MTRQALKRVNPTTVPSTSVKSSSSSSSSASPWSSSSPPPPPQLLREIRDLYGQARYGRLRGRPAGGGISGGVRDWIGPSDARGLWHGQPTMQDLLQSQLLLRGMEKAIFPGPVPATTPTLPSRQPHRGGSD